MNLTRILLLTTMAAAPCALLHAQSSYEIQVYGSDLVDPGATMFEVHSNFTFEGSKTVVHGQYPTEHQLHETLAITHGFNDWFELGFYVFTSADSRVGWQWVGDHIRPRVAVPKSWSWPVGVSLSTEVGYQRAVYSPDTWTIEIRPIVDKTIGRLYLCFNPTVDRSFHGPSAGSADGLRSDSAATTACFPARESARTQYRHCRRWDGEHRAVGESVDSGRTVGGDSHAPRQTVRTQSAEGLFLCGLGRYHSVWR